MCGIFGFNWTDKKLLQRGLNAISHMGPDARGILTNEKVSLGHNRLSIIDLSDAGKQPMSNETKSSWIIFNGEIYNYLALKKTLGKHKFSSNTDTEVILHLYEDDGFEVVKKLQGMFSFCIYDSKKQLLFIARDRLGLKPIYYYKDKDKFMFSSEIKAILENPSIKRTPNLNALSSYLAFRANTGNDTFFDGIYKLPPAHFMVYDLKSNNIKIQRYWNVKFSPGNKPFKYYATRLKALLEDSVKGRLMSDVPYGAYLSGGVDSATIVALMSKYASQPVKTFSVGFEEEQHSELNEARLASKILRTDHHELLIKEDSIKALPNIIYQADEPIADPTAIPIYFLSKYAKKYCTVILTGEGADELFAGYPQYKFMKMNATILRKLPKLLRKSILNGVKLLPPKLLDKYFPFASALGEKGIKRFANYLMSKKFEEQYLNQVAIFNQAEQVGLLGEAILYEKYASHFNNTNEKNIIGKCQELDLKGSMVEDLLMKIDKNTMAFSIEARAPFLDYRVVEFASQIPDKYKIRGPFKDKIILRKIAGDFLPSEIANRKKKHFFVPIDSWLDNHLKKLRDTLLSEEYVKKQGIFNWNYIKEINRNLPKSRLFYARQLWVLITFQIWYKQYIEREKVSI